MPNAAKIVNTPYPEDMEIGIEEIKVTYIQNPDTNDDSEHYQRMTISAQPSLGDGDLPYYVNVSIPNFDDGTPGHWSLDLSEDITPILEDFKARLETKHTEIEKE
jgi:hypothetical protein